MPAWCIPAAPSNSPKRNGGACYRPISTRCFIGRRKRRRMLAAGKGGAIVNIASVLGFNPDKGVAAYATAKAGVIQLTKALAIELAFKGIRVNAIARLDRHRDQQRLPCRFRRR